MSSYNALAPFYDGLTYDVDYEAFAGFYTALFERYGKEPRIVLDAACGTGTLTKLMAENGYEMIGVDMSADMLSVAAEKMADLPEDKKPLLLNQMLQELDLYGTIDAAICSLDSINYIAGKDLETIFSKIALFLNPGGMLIFDINTPEKLINLDGEMFVDETDDVYCVWRAEFDEEEKACFYGMDIFSREGDVWTRDFEEHVEYLHEPEELTNLLQKLGFENIKVFGSLSMEPPQSGEERVFIAAEKRK